MRQRGPISARAPITASGPISALGIDRGIGRDHGGRMHAGLRRRQGMEQRGDARPGGIGFVGDDGDRARRHARGHVGMHDHRAGARLRQRVGVFAVVEEADLARLGGLQRRDTAQHQPARRRLGLARRRPPPPGYAGRSSEEARIPGDRRPRPCAHGSLAQALRLRQAAGAAGCRRRRLARRVRPAPAGGFMFAGDTPSGGITTVGQHLVEVLDHLRRQVELAGRAEDLRAVQHQVDAAADRHLLRHQFHRAVDLRHHVLAGLLDDAVPLAELAPRLGDAVLQLLLARADLLGRQLGALIAPASGRGRAASPAPSARPRSASGGARGTPCRPAGTRWRRASRRRTDSTPTIAAGGVGPFGSGGTSGGGGSCTCICCRLAFRAWGGLRRTSGAPADGSACSAGQRRRGERRDAARRGAAGSGTNHCWPCCAIASGGWASQCGCRHDGRQREGGICNTRTSYRSRIGRSASDRAVA